jgi:hypothetical protein
MILWEPVNKRRVASRISFVYPIWINQILCLELKGVFGDLNLLGPKGPKEVNLRHHPALTCNLTRLIGL